MNNSLGSFARKLFLPFRRKPDIASLDESSEDVLNAFDDLKSVSKDISKQNSKLIRNLIGEIRNLEGDHERQSRHIARIMGKSVRELESEILRLHKEHSDEVAKLRALIEQEEKIITDQMNNSSGEIAGLSSAIGGVRDYLSKSSVTNKRYQEGYDYQILKRFVKQIGVIIDDLDNKYKSPEANHIKELEYARDDLIDLLDRNGVERFIPDVGSVCDDNMRNYVEIVEEVEDTDDPNMYGRIAKVKKAGYRYNFNEDQCRCIVPAKVSLYKNGGIQ